MEKTGKKYCKAIVNLAVALVILLLFIWLVPKVLVLLMPFVVGWIIALIAGPLVHFFEEKVKLKRKAGSAFVIIVVIGLVITAAYLAGSYLVEEIIGLVNALPDMWKSLEADFEDIGKRLGGIYERFPEDVRESISAAGEEASTYIGDVLSQLSSPTIAAVGNFARRLPSVVIGIIMGLLSSYFFVAERKQINEWFEKNTPVSVAERYHQVRRSLTRSVGGYFKAQLKIEVWMYLLLVIGLSILEVDYVLLIALGIAILDLLPFFGTGTVMVPWAIIKILSGNYQMAIGLLIIWGGGQLARQLIQPKIVGDSVGVPPIPTLFLLYIGYRIGGVIGMILGVPIGLLLYTMYQEGAFDTTKNSILILIAGLERFRRLVPHDLEDVEEMLEKERDRKK